MLNLFPPSLLMYILTLGRINKYLDAEYQAKISPHILQQPGCLQSTYCIKQGYCSINVQFERSSQQRKAWKLESSDFSTSRAIILNEGSLKKSLHYIKKRKQIFEQQLTVALFTLESYLFSHIHSSTPFSEGVAQKSWPMLSTIHLPIMFMKWPFITVERIFPRKCQSILCVSYLILLTHILKQLQLSH